MRRKVKITEKQTKFAQNYVKNGFNAKQAAIDAGYSESFAEKSSFQLAKHEGINQQVERVYARITEDMEVELGVTLVNKIKVLTKMIDDIMGTFDGEPKRDYYKDVCKAINELNKMQGHLVPNRAVTLNIDATKDKLLEAKRIYEEF